jgi:predicted nuclease of predicted toxin-antitoxin system
MIIADENIDNRIIKAIRAIPIHTISVFESYRGINDEDVLFLSKELEKIILTEDKDFGEWIFAHKVKGVSVIFLRYHYSETDEIIKILVKLLKDNKDRLYNKFTTITINKIRAREI